DGVAALHGRLGADAAGVDGWIAASLGRVAAAGNGAGRTHFLHDVEEHGAFAGHARAYLEDHAGIDVLHAAVRARRAQRVDRDRVDRHLGADIERGLGVVADEDRWGLQQADIGNFVEG